jgi:hypothetical protein
MQWWSVLLAYPATVWEDSQQCETYYTFVKACDRNEATRRAYREVLAVNDWSPEDYALDQFDELLVLKGRHWAA